MSLKFTLSLTERTVSRNDIFYSMQKHWGTEFKAKQDYQKISGKTYDCTLTPNQKIYFNRQCFNPSQNKLFKIKTF